MTRSRTGLGLLLVLTASLALAACGGDDEEGTTAAGTAAPAATTAAGTGTAGTETAATGTTAADATDTATTDTPATDTGATGTETGDTGLPGAPLSAECTADALDTVAAGKLTVGTDKPAYPPYFVDDDPSNGQGFESAVAYAVAERLGFTREDVEWTVVPFNASFAPGDKDFDFDINQISITEERRQAVDFSSPYYTAPQAVIATADSPVAGATSLADLKDAKLGVQIGTTSLDAVTEYIQPSTQPQVFNDSNDTVRALKNGQVEAIVTDLPTAFYLAAAEIEGGKIVGQFAAPGGDEWGLLLEKGSTLTPCVSEAVDSLRADGTLDGLTEQWMGTEAGAPELR